MNTKQKFPSSQMLYKNTGMKETRKSFWHVIKQHIILLIILSSTFWQSSLCGTLNWYHNKLVWTELYQNKVYPKRYFYNYYTTYERESINLRMCRLVWYHIYIKFMSDVIVRYKVSLKKNYCFYELRTGVYFVAVILWKSNVYIF